MPTPSTPPPRPGEITGLLEHVSHGDRGAFDRLFPLVYEELRFVALRLVGADVACQNRSHFFGIASRAMRTILIDYARARLTLKRGSGAVPVPLEDATAVLADDRVEHLVSLDEALRRLEDVSPEASRTVECRYFAGLSLEEAAEALDLSVATVRRRWDFAKAWLRKELDQAS